MRTTTFQRGAAAAAVVAALAVGGCKRARQEVVEEGREPAATADKLGPAPAGKPVGLAEEAEPSPSPATASAQAQLVSAGGHVIKGTAVLTERDGAIEIRLDATGLPPGKHGLVFHEGSACEGAEFESAGRPFAPGHVARAAGASAGTAAAPAEAGPPGPAPVGTASGGAAELGPVVADADGKTSFTGVVRGVTLGAASPDATLLIGRSLVVHTDGVEGAPLACAVIQRL
jgi:Cu-Zn family superoxide dismutase